MSELGVKSRKRKVLKEGKPCQTFWISSSCMTSEGFVCAWVSPVLLLEFQLGLLLFCCSVGLGTENGFQVRTKSIKPRTIYHLNSAYWFLNTITLYYGKQRLNIWLRHASTQQHVFFFLFFFFRYEHAWLTSQQWKIDCGKPSKTTKRLLEVNYLWVRLLFKIEQTLKEARCKSKRKSNVLLSFSQNVSSASVSTLPA